MGQQDTHLRVGSALTNFQVTRDIKRPWVSSDSLHSVWWALSSSLSRQKAPFHSCLWLSNLLYPFRLYLFRLFPCSSYCKYCCSEPQGASIVWNYGFLQVHAQECDCWVIRENEVKPEREKQILYNIAYMGNIDKWYRWIYLQKRNKHRWSEKMCGNEEGKGGGGMNWKTGMTYLCIHIKYITNQNLLYNTGSSIQCSVVT